MSLTDRTLYCRDCNQEFTFTVGEQEFYASRGLTNDPSRCPECRAARKQSGGGQRSSFGRGGGGGGGVDTVTAKHARCIALSVPIVATRPRYPFNREKIDLSIAMTAINRNVPIVQTTDDHAGNLHERG